MINSLKAWLARPFREEGDAFQWLMFTGLIVVAVILWRGVLKDLGVTKS